MGVEKSIQDTLHNYLGKIPRCKIKWWKEEENKSWKIEPHLWKNAYLSMWHHAHFLLLVLYFSHSCVLISVRKNMSLNLKIITKKTKQRIIRSLKSWRLTELISKFIFGNDCCKMMHSHQNFWYIGAHASEHMECLPYFFLLLIQSYLLFLLRAVRLEIKISSTELYFYLGYKSKGLITESLFIWM